MFGSHKLLNTNEIHQTLKSVDQLKQAWIQRHPMLPFYTLGAAAYLDTSTRSHQKYYEYVEKYNATLETHFEWLYQKVLAKLSDITQKPCHLEQQKALPGFHIFGIHPRFMKPVGSIHYDYQFEYLKWDQPDLINFEDQTISFTLALELPSGQAGLHIWPEYSDRKKLNIAALHRLIEEDKVQPPEFHQYQEGNIIVHTGNTLHQIAPLTQMIKGERRITLQGHAVLHQEKGYLVYW